MKPSPRGPNSFLTARRNSAAARDAQAVGAVDPARSAAFFDVDNTMIVGASIFHFARGLASRHFFSWSDLLRFGMQQGRLRLLGESSGGMTTARDSALAFVAGKSVDEIVTLGEQIYDEEMADKIWSGTNALAQLHLDAGQRVWLVTATPQELAMIIAQRLKLTGALGTVAETREGLYTGRLIGDVLHGEAKAAAVRRLAAEQGLDLEQCSAYSDSINDLPMLSLVGRAVAVNPDNQLRAAARERGWEIRDFRTGRKAARIGVPASLGVGAVAGAVVAGSAMRKAYKDGSLPALRAATEAASTAASGVTTGAVAIARATSRVVEKHRV